MIPFGNKIKMSFHGASRDEKITLRIENFPAGVKLDRDILSSLLRRRAPKNDGYSTSRKENDDVNFVSGMDGDITNGSEIVAEIYNTDIKSDGENHNDVPRPSHADYAAVCKYGKSVDLRGGGAFSGRMTALYCVAGALAMSYLSSLGIRIFSHIYSISDTRDVPFDMANVGERERKILCGKEFRVIDDGAGALREEKIKAAKARGDSLGGVVECAVTGLAAGIGEHSFASCEGMISLAVFGIPSVKGIEFGSGFAGAESTGSQNNDAFYTDGKSVFTKTNNSGGILGGMTSGMPG
ncbi:MAG: chorismate synthase, partial [Clostridiales bacterium]|nr:chorismate synthase [Clostridiales bacterium]